jgi:HlyD family secretion protein
MKFPGKRSRLVITGIVLATIISGALYFTQSSAADESAAPELQTAKVRTGDLVITANGAGTIVPAAQVDIGFRSSGMVGELNVQNGDAVTAAQTLARLEENIQAEADFQALFSAQGLAQAELAVANAEAALEDATNAVIYLVGSDAWYWEGQLDQAEAAVNTLDAAATSSQREEAQKVVDDARARMDYFLGLRDIPDVDIALARAEFESAKVALRDAQAALEIVKAGPNAFTAPIAALGTETAKLEQARLAVQNTRLVAPFDGSVVALDVVKGQTVGTSPVMTIATTDHLLARFYLDETDIEKAAAGMQVTFTLDAYPDETVNGEIVLVEPALQIVDGTPVVVVWASLPEEAPFSILSGMTVEAEVIAAESRNALLVPVQALRELTPGSFAVFVVSPDGQLKMTPVTAGLRDFANAEILSGLKVGDVVSTGTVETK